LSPDRGKGFLSSPKHPDWLRDPSSLLDNWYHGLFHRGYSNQGMKLTTHFSLIPRLRLSGAIPLLPLYAFMACTGTLPLPLYLVAKQ